MEELKIISIYSRKGGSGKTTLAFHLCKHLDNTYYMSNDDDGSETIIETLGEDRASLVKNEIPNCSYLVYDGGGYVDDTSLTFLKNSNYIVIPSNFENRSLRSARKVIDELISNHRIDNNKIILVINRYKENPKTKEEKELIKSVFEELENIVYIRDSKMYENLIDDNKTFKEYGSKYPIFRKLCNNLENEFNILKDIVK